MKKAIVGALALGLVLAFGFGVYTGFSGQPKINAGDPANQSAPTLEQEESPKSTEYSLVATVNGQTALELLKATTEVELKQYDFGAMISAINGLVANDSYYWAFYLNDEYAKQAADKTVLDAGDKVEFKYEKIEAFPLE